jgi:hypothetical protein
MEAERPVRHRHREPYAGGRCFTVIDLPSDGYPSWVVFYKWR